MYSVKHFLGLVLICIALAFDWQSPRFVDAQIWEPFFVPGSGGRIDSISVQPGNSLRVLSGGDLFGVGSTSDGGLTWTGDHTGIENDRINDFTWDPKKSNRVWMGTVGGPHVSVDAGATWTLKRNGMPETSNGQATAPIQKILFDPNDPESDRLLAFVGDHRSLDSTEGQYSGKVWISENNGDDWSVEVTIVPDANITDAEYAAGSGNVIYAAVLDHGIYRSINDGLDWAPVNNGLPVDAPVQGIETHPTNPLIAWIVIADAGVYITEDGGESWTLSNNGLIEGTNGFNFFSIEIASVDTDGIATLYVANGFRGQFNGNFGTGIYKSQDSGESWSHILSNQSQIENFDAFPMAQDSFGSSPT